MSDNKKPSVVIIDDEQCITDLLVDIFKIKSYNVSCFNCSEKGFNSVVENNPDLLFIDLFMPFVDGPEVIKKIKKNKVNTKIVLMSGGFDILDDDSFSNDLEKFGADAILNKPFKIKEVNEAISKLIIAD